ncbi:hypothetical protein EV356DRAFT_570233 [Viridothelium virens]|uniref:Uncharacterized protein n=1 Tax=Viridothelium virens TaxID=1048519 RepID=A0A6A6GY76_VIRVR|nr:hypothetical protein EV356DRAFT_570233 [Viridothelium virens]
MADASTPPPPALTYLCNINLEAAPPVIVGATALGQRRVVTITGGTFAGPKLNGKVNGGTIWSVTSESGVSNVDAVYTMQTDDGASIMVTEKAHVPNVLLTFETASTEYAWLNKITAYASGAPSKGKSTLITWQVGV